MTPLSLIGAAWPGMLIGYLLGSLSFAVIISRLLQRQDVRTEGSGNAGATNMLRTFGWAAAGMTLLGDLLKGSLSVLIARAIAPPEWAFYAGYLAALSAVVGHMKPVFFGFRGGKSVATAVGAMAVLSPLALVLVLLFAIPIIILSDYVSFGVLCGVVGIVVVQPALRVAQGRFDWTEQVLLMILAALIINAHRENIARLRSGTERRLRHNKKESGKEDGA